MMRPHTASGMERGQIMREGRYRENQRMIDLPKPKPRAVPAPPDPLDPRLLELLPHRPKAWRKFVEPIPAELVEFWISKEPRHCLLAEFACTSGQWRCLWQSGDIEAYAQQGIRYRVLLLERDQAEKIRCAHPLIDISLNDQMTRLRFARSEGEVA